MKKQYEVPEMEIRQFETENICALSQNDDGTGYIPETEGGADTFGW